MKKTSITDISRNAFNNDKDNFGIESYEKVLPNSSIIPVIQEISGTHIYKKAK